MSGVNKILEDITEQLSVIYQFLESLNGDEINVSAKASLINIRNLTKGILNRCNELINERINLR